MTYHTSDIESDAAFFSTQQNFGGMAAGRVADFAQPASGGGLSTEAPSPFYRYFFKRAFESLLILASAPLTLPLVGVMALLIWMEGGKPFYTQTRIGRGGSRFRIWKLRTMVQNADDMLETHLRSCPAARREWDSTQKLKSDPRITRLGRMLRKSSLDELPQLLNVLNGTMALVGPRPMMVGQQQFYHGDAYYRLRPGITGLWQISERNESEFRSRVRYDDQYDRGMSLALDASILARTVSVVLRGTGY